MSKFKPVFPLITAFLLLAGIIFPVQAQDISTVVASAPVPSVTTTSDCFALSNEAMGNLISHLVTVGYGTYNLYDLLVSIQQSTDPSVNVAIPDTFLNALASSPVNSEIFTISLKTMDIPGNKVEACTDGTVQTMPVSGFSAAAKGFPTLVSNISGVGYANFTHTTDTSGYIATWVVNGTITTTYRVFGVAWGIPFRIYLPWTVK